MAKTGEIENLNDLAIYAERACAEPIRSKRGPVVSGAAEAVFDGLIDRLCVEIEKWPVVIGCMAWLSNQNVLKALSSREQVSIIVQKEDFLRPDIGNWSKPGLQRLYGALPGFRRSELGAGRYSHHEAAERIESVRCCGVARSDSGQAPPRMHHKFLVFGTLSDRGVPDERLNGEMWIDRWDAFDPAVVWTGSLNATENGSRSLENAVLLRDPTIASAYHREWSLLIGLSEPLDWMSTYVEPQFWLMS